MSHSYRFNLKTCYYIAAIQSPLVFFLFLPNAPIKAWQYQLLEFIHQDLNITLGANGPLPLYTPVVAIYIAMISLVFCIFCLYKFIQEYGMGKKFQEKIYAQTITFIDAKYTRWLIRYPILRKFYIYSVHLLFIAMTCWHFSDENISFHRSRKGGLIALGYQYRVGVILWEYLFQILFIGNIIALCLYILYSFNILRGLGWGKIQVQPIEVSQPRKKSKRGKAKK